MRDKTCCLIGHSKIYEDISALVEQAVEQHIVEYGVTDFLVGNYGDFDRMGAAAVKKAKVKHPEVKLYLMLPYLPEKGRILPDREGYDGFIYPEEMEGVAYKWAIAKLNRLMVQESAYVIAYVTHGWGGAAATLDYAGKRAVQGLLHIENLGEGRL